MHTLNISKFKINLFCKESKHFKEKDAVHHRYLLIFVLSFFFNFLVQHSYKHNNLLKCVSGDSARYVAKIWLECN